MKFGFKPEEHQSEYTRKNIENEDLEQVPEIGIKVEKILGANKINDEELSDEVPEWSDLVSEKGYQHNGVLLGEHTEDAIQSLKLLPDMKKFSGKERNMAMLAMLFHDFGKPIGGLNENVPRDFNHEIPSAQIATKYLEEWGYKKEDIETIILAIKNDGVVSDIARGKVRDHRKDLTPEQFMDVLKGNKTAMKIIRAINKADVIATVGLQGYSRISEKYDEYFSKILPND